MVRLSLKLHRSSATIWLEFYWSASGKVLKRAEMPFMKPNGKSESDRQHKQINELQNVLAQLKELLSKPVLSDLRYSCKET